MKYDILTIFPDIFDSYINKGMIRIAQEKKIVTIKTHNLRDFAVDKHGTVDDRPYGGGPGQVLMVEPVVKALKKLKVGPVFSKVASLRQQAKSPQVASKVAPPVKKVILLSAKGKKWTQQMAQKYAKKYDQLIFVCPRYEGHDERITKFVDDEISIGDYVLTGGELGAMVIIDSVTRLIPGVLGKPESLNEESHSTPGYLEYPQYSRPEKFKIKNPKLKIKSLDVPKILLTGHHENINKWRQSKSKNK